ncbi:MAG: 30S ribosomal protein S9 [Candidatus Omnitrophota bacterium]
MAETKKEYFTAIGRRKESVARVRIRSGEGKVKVNKRPFEDYFPRETHRIDIMLPLKAAGLEEKVDVYGNLTGGGLSGQAGAFRHGIARALLKYDESLRIALKKAGFLTRDPRAKERKKYGQKRARKHFQFSKR